MRLCGTTDEISRAVAAVEDVNPWVKVAAKRALIRIDRAAKRMRLADRESKLSKFKAGEDERGEEVISYVHKLLPSVDAVSTCTTLSPMAAAAGFIGGDRANPPVRVLMSNGSRHELCCELAHCLS